MTRCDICGEERDDVYGDEILKARDAEQLCARLVVEKCGCEHGSVDSGGVTPWDAPIDIPCPECKGRCYVFHDAAFEAEYEQLRQTARDSASHSPRRGGQRMTDALLPPRPEMATDELASRIGTLSAAIHVWERLRDAEDKITRLRNAVRQAHHELTTLHGLTACDGTTAWYRAWEDGADANGAWDAFTESTWVIDESAVLAVLDAATN